MSYIPLPHPPPNSPSSLVESVEEIADKPPILTDTGLSYIEDMLQNSGDIGESESVIRTIKQLGFEKLFSQDVTIAQQLVRKIVAMSLAVSKNNTGISNKEATLPSPSQPIPFDHSSPSQGKISESPAGNENQFDVTKYTTGLNYHYPPMERTSVDIPFKSASPVAYTGSRHSTPRSFDINALISRERLEKDQLGDVNDCARLPDTPGPPSSGESYIRKRRQVLPKNSRSLQGKERLIGNSDLTSRLSVLHRKRQEKIKQLNQESRRNGKSREPSTEAEESSMNQSADSDSSTISGDIHTLGTGSTTITHHRLRRELSLIRTAFFAEVEKSWDQVIKLYLDSSSEQVSRTRLISKSKRSTTGVSSVQKISDLRTAVRIHLKALMFPGVKYDPTANRIFWNDLGLWLYSKKKRFINWDSKIPFPILGGAINRMNASLLRKMLKIGLTSWNEDERRNLKPEIPLVVDRKDLVLLKVEDLAKMYPNKVILVGRTLAHDTNSNNSSMNTDGSGTESASNIDDIPTRLPSPTRHLHTGHKHQGSSASNSVTEKYNYEGKKEQERSRKRRKLQVGNPAEKKA